MGVTLLLLALLAQAPNTDAPPTITGVEVRLPAGADARLLDRVSQLVPLRKGQPLSRRAVARAIESLFATGRFSDVEVLGVDGPEGVEIVINLVPRQNVGTVFVEGATQLTRDEVKAATGLEAGAEYWPERVEQAAENVRALYARRGYRATEVRTEAVMVEGALSVGFVIREGPPTVARAVVLSGDPGLPLATVLEAFGLRPGEVLDLSLVDQGLERVRALYRRERFYRARVEPAELTDDGRLVIPVVAGPRYDLIFSGNRAVSDHGLRAVLAYDGEETLDESLAQRLAQRLERFYRFRGFHDVRVTSSEVRGRGGAAALGFAIDEGLPVRVVSIAFDGAKELSPDELRSVLVRVMETAAPRPPFELFPMGEPTELTGRRESRLFGESLPSPPLDTVLEEPTWAEAAKAMLALYRERGYLKASVTFGGAEVREGVARARFVVEEGARAQFRSLTPKGLPPNFSSETVAALEKGKPFSAAELERLEQGVTRELGRKGYLFASVTGAYQIDASGQQVDATLEVEPGPQVKVRAVLPVGQLRTSEETILAQATMKEGLPLDSEALFTTQANLASLGIFRSVQVEMLAPERPEPLKTIVLRVRERPLLSFEWFLGYFYADGFRGGLEGTVANIGGRGITLTGRAQANLLFTSIPALFPDSALGSQLDLRDIPFWEQIGGRANLSLDARSLLPAGFGLRLDGVFERVFRPQFRFSRVAALPTLSWTHAFEVPRVEWLRPKLTLALQYELEWTSVSRVGSALASLPPVSLADQERLRFLFGRFTLQGARLNATLDLRDNALTPTRGLLLQGAGEVVSAIYARDEQDREVPVSFLKVNGSATGYVPLGARFVFALSARAGRIFPLVQGATTPPVRRFFLGGATSMRGFNEDQLIAEDSRETYRAQVRDCQMLATKAGCSSAAQTIAAARQVPSQGGELFALFKAELRFPAFSVFDLGVFFETGNLWLAVPERLTFRPVVGTGLRLGTPIGPLAVDLGVNLAPDLVINEPQVVLHFNIGVF
ncbi:MAG: POTRA domain-containing protein [Myxococcota bacterium]